MLIQKFKQHAVDVTNLIGVDSYRSVKLKLYKWQARHRRGAHTERELAPIRTMTVGCC